jgi:hypothetical protein
MGYKNIAIYFKKGSKRGSNTLMYALAKTALKLDGNTFFSSNFVNHKRQRIPLTYY